MKGQPIVKPIMTEKMHIQQEKTNSYAFEVVKDANKMEIKAAIEAKFDVKVKHVRTMNIRGKTKSMTVRSGGRVIRTRGRKPHWKKAIVTLLPGEKIDLFGTEA